MPLLDLTERFIDTPLLISQQMAHHFKMGGDKQFLIEAPSEETSDLMFSYSAGIEQGKPYRMIGSVAVIPIVGTLLHRYNWCGWGVTGYDYIKTLLKIALEDDEVEGIIFDIHSGGGEVNGAFETADLIFQSREIKPSLSIVNAHCYSAAYLLGSASTKMVVAKTGGVGSIGVVTMHGDWSTAMERAGIVVTYIHAGKHKVDGNPYQKLSADVKKRIQTRVDQSYDLFVNAVAAHRGLDTKKIRSTEAQTYSAEEGVNLGLADEVASPDEVLQSITAELNGTTKKGKSMAKQRADNKAKHLLQAGSDNSLDDEQLYTLEEAQDMATQAAKAERDRINAVVKSDEYVGREDLANAMLENESLSSDAIIAMLAKAPASKSEGGDFQSAMDGGDHPNVGGDPQGGGNDDQDDDKAAVDKIMGSWAFATNQTESA